MELVPGFRRYPSPRLRFWSKGVHSYAMPPLPPSVLIGQLHHRTDRRVFKILGPDRLQHVYVIGKTGAGKTTLLEGLARQDVLSGTGFALLDPHGDLAERIHDFAGRVGATRVHIIDPADPSSEASYNPLAYVHSDLRPLIAGGLLDVFRKMWSEAWGPRMEHVLRNTLLALLDYPGSTLPDTLRILSDKTFRFEVLRRVQNAPVRDFWKKEFPRYSVRFQADAIAPIQTKIGALLSDPRLYRFFMSDTGRLRLRSIMDRGEILIINLSKGRLGADSALLLGGVLTTSLALAAFSRGDQEAPSRRPFFIYLDEFQSFTTLAIAEMLSELRKFGVGMIMAHQYLAQLDPAIRHAVLGNAGTLISFRVGAEDAAYLAKEFEPKFARLDLINLPNHHIYLKLLINGQPSKPFSATTLTTDEIAHASRLAHERLA